MKFIILAVALAMAPAAAAHDYRIGSLTIDHPVLRVASPVSKTGAGFMAVTNRGKVADRLVSVTTTASARADLHGTVANGNVMQMRAQAGGVPPLSLLDRAERRRDPGDRARPLVPRAGWRAVVDGADVVGRTRARDDADPDPPLWAPRAR